MNKEAFRLSMNNPRPNHLGYSERWADDVVVFCYKLTDDGHTFYRVILYHSPRYSFSRKIYSTDEVDLQTVEVRIEELECLTSLSSSLFSWIGT